MPRATIYPAPPHGLRFSIFRSCCFNENKLLTPQVVSLTLSPVQAEVSDLPTPLPTFGFNVFNMFENSIGYEVLGPSYVNLWVFFHYRWGRASPPMTDHKYFLFCKLFVLHPLLIFPLSCLSISYWIVDALFFWIQASLVASFPQSVT